MKPPIEPIADPTEGEWRYEYRGPWNQNIVTSLPGMAHNVLVASLGTQREVDANGYLMAAAKKLKAALVSADKVIRALNRGKGGPVVNQSVTDEIRDALKATTGPKQAMTVEWNPDRRPKQKPAAPEKERLPLDVLLAGLNPLEQWIVERTGRQMKVFHYHDIGGLSVTGHKIIWRVDLEENDTLRCGENFSDLSYRSVRKVTTYSANGETLPEAVVAALQAAEKGAVTS